MPQSTPASPVDRLAMGYQLKQFKIHLPGIIPQISRRVLGQGDTTLAELHHIFQVVMDWENWHLHRFHLWGKDYGLGYAGGTWYADDARRVHLGDFRGGSMISSPTPMTSATIGSTRCGSRKCYLHQQLPPGRCV